MKVEISRKGKVRFVYEEEVGLIDLGTVAAINRVSTVEPDKEGTWWITVLATGVTMGPYTKRSDAIKAEIAHIEQEMK